MIDPRTTNIVGARVRLVRRADHSNVQGRGVVRVVDYNQGAFTLLIEAVGSVVDESWYRACHGELFQVSLFDETIAIVIEGDAPSVAPPRDLEILAEQCCDTFHGEVGTFQDSEDQARWRKVAESLWELGARPLPRVPQ